MFKKVGDLVMSQSISSRIAQVQRYINEHPADAFRLGIIYGMLNEIRKDAKEQEELMAEILLDKFLTEGD